MWNHLNTNGIATNNDPHFGGIIDSAIVSGKWFVIPNSDLIPIAEDFNTKQEAMDYLEAKIKEVYITE